VNEGAEPESASHVNDRGPLAGALDDGPAAAGDETVGVEEIGVLGDVVDVAAAVSGGSDSSAPPVMLAEVDVVVESTPTMVSTVGSAVRVAPQAARTMRLGSRSRFMSQESSGWCYWFPG